MYKIIKKENLAPEIYSFEIEAPRVAKKAEPGQFVIVIVSDGGERIPLTICDTNLDNNTVQIVVQAIGASTRKLAAKDAGDYISDFVGPLGLPSKFVEEDIDSLRKKNILLVGGGVGTAPLIPQAKWFKENDVKFDVLIGAKTKDFIILEDKFENLAENLYIATDDGSYGFSGMIPSAIEDLVKNKNKTYDMCIIVGPMIMMKFTALMTKSLEIPSIVSLNPLMVDGTGMCGACRVNIGGETKFACVDGPEFDAHLVDFDEALRRQSQYKDIEIKRNHEYCDLLGGENGK